MKIEKIDSRIAALYIGQKWERLGTTTTFFADSISAWGIGDGDRLNFKFYQVAPHLRRLESLTEDEARELYEIKYGESWEKSFHDISINVSPCLENFWKEDIELYAPEGKLLIGSPAVWLKLLEWGIDLFGLIDAGLAKEIEPKNT